MLNQEFTLKYGNEKVKVNVNEENLLHVLTGKELSPISNIEEFIESLLDNPVGTTPFNDLFTAGDRVVIIISDISRLWVKVDLILPTLLKRMNQLGISDSQITILNATGTHRPNSADELKLLVGAEVYHRVRVINHEYDDTANLVNIGVTSRGTEVLINRIAVEADKVILTGGIVHHLMAGFGGGRKSILPGIAGGNTIAQNHLHCLNPEGSGSNPLTGVGLLESNPLHLDMVEAASFLNSTFLINNIIGTSGQIVNIVAGHWNEAWLAGCKWADDNFGVPISQKADLVIASSGGYPKDISLYQGTKTLFNAALGTKPGGTILLLMECKEGAGANEFFGWSKFLKDGTIEQELRRNFTIPGYIFYAAVQMAKTYNVVLLSTIDPEDTKPMGFIPVQNLDEALSKVYELTGPNPQTIVMPYGGSTVPLAP